MGVRELTREQIAELKQAYLTDKLYNKENRSPSYYELSQAEANISDEELFEYYDGTYFTTDDFCCTAGS